MNENKRNVPKLRFPEFEGDWEISPIGEYTELISGIALKGEEITENKEGRPILRGINITEGSIRHSPDIDRFFLGNDKRIDKFIVTKGDMVLGMDGSKVGKNVAIVGKDDDGAILIQRVARIRSKKNAEIKYVFQKVFSSDFHKYVDAVNTSSAIPHISLQQIKDFTIGFPSLPEQQKIAAFLTAIDTKIELLNKEKALLEQYKKGLMQAIFADNVDATERRIKIEGGKVTRKIRFKDEKGNDFPDWEEKTLGDVGTITGGGTPETSVDTFWNGEIQWFTPTELKTKYVSNSLRTISSTGLNSSSAKLLPIGTILFSSRATVGDVSIILKECTTNQGFQSITVNSQNDNEFIYYWLTNNKKLFLRKASGSIFLEINKNEMHKINILLPTIKEQRKISKFLCGLDMKIDGINAQIKSTSFYKKGLLQQLFV